MLSAGEVAEWSNVPDSKSGVVATSPWVRIPPSPPSKIYKSLKNNDFFNLQPIKLIKYPCWYPTYSLNLLISSEHSYLALGLDLIQGHPFEFLGRQDPTIPPPPPKLELVPSVHLYTVFCSGRGQFKTQKIKSGE